MAGAADPWNSSCKQVFANHIAGLASFRRRLKAGVHNELPLAPCCGEKSFLEDIEWAFTMGGCFRGYSTS
jgi:hypothetical protein